MIELFWIVDPTDTNQTKKPYQRRSKQKYVYCNSRNFNNSQQIADQIEICCRKIKLTGDRRERDRKQKRESLENIETSLKTYTISPICKLIKNTTPKGRYNSWKIIPAIYLGDTYRELWRRRRLNTPNYKWIIKKKKKTSFAKVTSMMTSCSSSYTNTKLYTLNYIFRLCYCWMLNFLVL